MDADSPIMRQIYIGIAAIAGAITALSLMNWRNMSWPEVWITLFVGASFAMFAVPWLAGDILKINDSTLRAACGLTYLGGTCANALIPPLIRRAKRMLSISEEQKP